MIGRILPRGHGVAGLLGYLLGPGKANRHVNPRIVAAWNGDPARLEPPRDDRGRPVVGRLAGWLEQPLARLGDRAPAEPVFHVMVRCAPGDPDLPDRAMAAVAVEFMHRTGLSRRGMEHAGVRWVAVCHGDNHVHIMATLARQDGGRARLSRERIILGEVRRWAEAAGWASGPAERARYQLQAAPRPDRTAAKRPTRAEAEKARRNKRPEVPRVTLRRAVQAASAGARTEAEFADRLAGHGVLVKWRTSPTTGEVIGYAVGLPGDLTAARLGHPARQLYYSGRELAADLTWPKLRARWAGPRLSGQAITPAVARAVMAREVTGAARLARTEEEFEAALAKAGLLVHWRAAPGPETGRPGPARAGYAVSLPGLSGPDGRTAWIACEQLHPGGRLALGTMRARWAEGHPGAAASGPEELFGGADREAIYAYAADVADRAAREMRLTRSTARTGDIAQAAAAVLAAAYAATRNPGLRQAAEGFERAARPPWGRVPPRTALGDALRTAAWCLYHCQRRHSPGTVLLTALAGLARALADLRQAQRRYAQAEAARRAGRWIEAPATATTFRPSRPAESVSRTARRAPFPQPQRRRSR